MKPGIKTTEFWLTVAGNVAAILLTFGEVLDPKTGSVLMAIGNGLYAISRGLAKKQ